MRQGGGVFRRAAAKAAPADREPLRFSNPSGAHRGGRILFALPVVARARDGAGSSAGSGRSTGARRAKRSRVTGSPQAFRLMGGEGLTGAGPASLIVVDPNGHRARVELSPLPFKIGRQADSHLILRDSRASRNHAQIVLENDRYVIEDSDSRHGVYVNGARVKRRLLENSDRIEFGVP